MIYRPDIDGLRALAISAVLINHAFPTILPGGFIGVDIFFVISGYLITGILLQEQQAGAINLTRFYLKRVRRLLPALILVLFACLVSGWFVLLANEYEQLAKHTVGAGIFIINFMLLSESGYFDVSSKLKPLLHLWSLGIEEQFYVIWPILLLWCISKRKPLIHIIITVLLTSLALSIYYTYKDNAVAFYLPVTRMWELAAGGLLAAWHTYQPKYRVTQASEPLAVAGLLLLIMPMWFINKNLAWPGLWAIFPVLGTLCLIQVGDHAFRTRSLLTNKWVVWLGLISYPLYLWHWPVLTFVRIEYGVDLPDFLTAFLILLSIFLAVLTYFFIERPTRRTTERKTFLPLIVLLMLVTASALFIFLRAGLPDRSSLKQLEINQAQLTRLQVDPSDTHVACLKTFRLTDDVRYCNMSGSHPQVALIGDSHARAMYDGLAAYMKDRGESLLNVGGRLFLGIDTYLKGSEFERRNSQGSQQATQMIIENKNIKHIVMFALGPAYISGRTDHVFILNDRPEIQDPLEVWEQGMRQTLNALIKADKQVTVVLNNPELTFDPRQCLNRPLSWLTQQAHACVITKQEFDIRNDTYRRLMKHILSAYPQVKIFDMANYLCDDQFCYAQKDGTLMYRDDNHLSEAGAQWMAPKLYQVIRDKSVRP